jgi:glycosyltransferase involved in cell wall biosynthesis
MSGGRAPEPRATCLLFLPFTYSGGGVPETAATLASGMGAAGLDIQAFIPRLRRPMPANVPVRQTLPLPLRYARWTQIWKPALWTLERAFRRAVDRADPARTVAYFWPSYLHAPSTELIEHTKARGIPTVREMVNCPVSTGQPIMNAVYAKHGHSGHHNLSDELVAHEADELPRYDNIFAPNPEVEAGLLRMGIPAARILPTTYGFRRSRFPVDGPAAPKPSSGIRAVFVGIVGLRKGAPELLAAWERADVHGELILIGDLDSELAPLLARATASGRVRHLPFTDDIAGLLRSADLFVLSTYEEGGPQVTYEAAACGAAIITTPMGAARLVEDGVTGLVVSPEDVDGLAAAIRKLADDAELRTRLAAAARDAADNFEYAAVARRRGETLRRIALGEPG